MKVKLLLLLVLVFVGAGFKCCICPTPSNNCSLSCNSGSTYDVIYTNPNCPPREIDNVTCIVPFPGISFARDCQGGCQARLFERRFFGFFLTAAPSGIDLNAQPSSVTITGQGMDATYGMPRVDYLDEEGYLIGSTYATEVAGDGTQLVAGVPNLSQVWSGNYQVRVVNKTWEEHYGDEVGYATISCWGRDRPDSDGDGWYDDEDCYPFNASLWDCYQPPDDCRVTYQPQTQQDALTERGSNMILPEPCY